MSEFPRFALVVGASSGIGLAVAEQLASMHIVETLVLCSRVAESSEILRRLQSQCQSSGKRCILVNTDITDPASLSDLTNHLNNNLQVIDLIINTVGILHGDGIVPEKLLEHVSLSAMHKAFTVNAFGPLLLAQALLPWLKLRRRVVFASLSARVGSIADNQLGGWYSYRASKAAQNQLMKTLSIELRRRNPESIVLSLHPGTTDTPLSRPFQSNVESHKLFTPAFVADRLLQLVTQANVEDSGRFIAWDGQPIPW